MLLNMNTFRLSILFLIVFSVCYSANGQRLRKQIDCKCRTRATGRIVGGKEITYPVPWQVSLAVRRDDGSLAHFCGGTIINRRYIMTASHCTEMFLESSKQHVPINRLRVRVGINELDDPVIEENTFLAKRVILDSRYKGVEASAVGDFALIELKGNIPRFTDKIQPACIPDNKTIAYEGDGALVATGWGSIRKTGRDGEGNPIPGVISNMLKQADFTYDENMLDRNGNEPDSCRTYLVCLKQKSNPDTPDDSVCNGDSGGPLHYTENGRTRVVGVAQFVLGNQYRDGSVTFCIGPGAYGRVSYYLPNLIDVVGSDYCNV